MTIPPKKSPGIAPVLKYDTEVKHDVNPRAFEALFDDRKMPAPLTRALSSMGFEKPTPIQAGAIPVALKGTDVLGCAQTGTGKTAAFSIPMISRLLDRPESGGLVLVPTRELAAQVQQVVLDLTRYTPELRPVLLIGGVSMDKQIRSLSRNPRLIIATPGRLVDHLQRRTANIKRIDTLVLDEADRMLDIGFAPQLKQILAHLPEKRHTMLFSATVPPSIEKLAQGYLKNPTRVTIGAPSTAKADITQEVMAVEHTKKNDTVLELLNQKEGSVLVFARTQSRADRLARWLGGYGIAVDRIHGGRTQGQRNRALDGFRSGAHRVLVATDIAARGIDIDHVAHVINYDLPQVAEDYIHRIGRTGRNGRKGQALSLVSREEKSLWKDIEKLLGKDSPRLPQPHQLKQAEMETRRPRPTANSGRPTSRPR
jgi:superfamily II DNA/RNA helicase